MDFSIFYHLLSALLVLIGLAGVVLPAIPGAVLIFAGLVFSAWLDNFHHVGWGGISVLAILTGLTYVLDILSGAFGVRQFGAGRAAVIGAACGVIIGLFFGIPGLLFLPFLGAVLGEMLTHGDLLQASKAGIGVWVGMLLGAVGKLAIAFTMIGIFLALRFF